MKQLIVLLTLMVAFAVGGCTGDRAKELFETAKFEELQNNREHALELYQEIVKKYPKSEYAKKAEERLKEMKEKK